MKNIVESEGNHPLAAEEKTPGGNNNDNQGMDPEVKRVVNKYGPDALGMTGSVLQLFFYNYATP